MFKLTEARVKLKFCATRKSLLHLILHNQSISQSVNQSKTLFTVGFPLVTILIYTNYLRA